MTEIYTKPREYQESPYLEIAGGLVRVPADPVCYVRLIASYPLLILGTGH
jgi:hypothetical protein